MVETAEMKSCVERILCDSEQMLWLKPTIMRAERWSADCWGLIAASWRLKLGGFSCSQVRCGNPAGCISWRVGSSHSRVLHLSCLWVSWAQLLFFRLSSVHSCCLLLFFFATLLLRVRSPSQKSVCIYVFLKLFWLFARKRINKGCLLVGYCWN